MTTQGTPDEKSSTSLVLQVGEVEDGKTPTNVQCAECKHVWVGFYLPQPISVIAKMMKNLTCPKCGTDSKRIHIGAKS